MMDCLPKTISFEKRGHVAIFTIDRPEALNAFTREMLVGMDAGFEEFQADPEKHGTRSTTGVMVCFSTKTVVICGTRYADYAHPDQYRLACVQGAARSGPDRVAPPGPLRPH